MGGGKKPTGGNKGKSGKDTKKSNKGESGPRKAEITVMINEKQGLKIIEHTKVITVQDLARQTGVKISDAAAASMSVPPFYAPFPIKNPEKITKFQICTDRNDLWTQPQMLQKGRFA